MSEVTSISLIPCPNFCPCHQSSGELSALFSNSLTAKIFFGPLSGGTSIFSSVFFSSSFFPNNACTGIVTEKQKTNANIIRIFFI
ncbi:MAG: hypothetical protein ACD_79C00264G0003 [uncultured bacterium]|nr:MAG: hypothetical protein ACD_79C00264G0003 [uncultured bacterium]